MKTEQEIKKAIDDLKGGFYGTAEIIDNFENDNYYLIRTEIADPSEDWECAEYHLLKKDLSESHYLAHCNGYDGYDIKMSDEEIAELTGEEDIEEYIESYEITGDLLAEAIKSMQEEADQNYDGECKVWIEYCYSAGTLNTPNDGFVRDENGEEITFENYEAAKNWIEENEDENYYLSHGEMGRPSYTIMQA